ncbi:Exotoxin A precursor (NAD-dependent ADP-ribosyltransferase) [Cystobacter fuscus DSM 2262]|uniref:Exotoxin A (NAD-dependent ADP-ribosyltransferase) n=1 Tax=Cystobacter fuscus (strain ATCC 25194 / DSM 2262 / NBRC 100088 / M29) TaxID=1242864 RepID=S9NZM2_CYSF2|nr:Exotoxin A precursor (NAD-dependent ADP-ribosyltransferase) [Cystobacter fuscus DSM 2262]
MQGGSSRAHESRPSAQGIYGNRTSASSSRTPTGAEILNRPYDGKFNRVSDQQLADAHNELTRRGYAFVGFKGSSEQGAMNAVNGGLRAQGGDKWSGIYVSDQTAVAAGYTADEMGRSKGGQLVRVYVPQQDAEKLQNLATPMDNPRVENEFRKNMGFRLGDDRSYIIRGQETTDDKYRTETVLSPKVAERAVAIPSTVLVDQKFGSGEVQDFSAFERQISQTPQGRAPLPSTPPAGHHHGR